MSNPLTQDQEDLTAEQLRRVDVWIAESVCGFTWARSKMSGQKFLYLANADGTYGGSDIEPAKEGDKPSRSWAFYVPHYTSHDSPRRLLDEAVRAIGEDKEDDFDLALMYASGNNESLPFDEWKVWLDERPLLVSQFYHRSVVASPVTICHALVLALGGKWPEVIGE